MNTLRIHCFMSSLAMIYIYIYIYKIIHKFTNTQQLMIKYALNKIKTVIIAQFTEC